jgi:hypothetical protein
MQQPRRASLRRSKRLDFVSADLIDCSADIRWSLRLRVRLSALWRCGGLSEHKPLQRTTLALDNEARALVDQALDQQLGLDSLAQGVRKRGSPACSVGDLSLLAG